ncbi:MAG: VOC family protein, partial [Pseudorhizobium sp.]
MRTVDHLVLPVEGLFDARLRLQKLGFVVAPDARHSFGTENACVFLQDGAYLEPLAIADDESYDRSADAGNVFTARDRQVRRLFPACGLSALVLASDDALADHVHYGGSGVSAGDLLEFSRAFKLPDGGEVEAAFRLAFAADEGSPCFLLFACERINALPRDLGTLARHANGVLGLREVVLHADDPVAHCHLLETVLAGEHKAVGQEVLFETRNGTIKVSGEQPSPLARDAAGSAGISGLSGRSVVFSVADLAVTEAVLAANDVAFLRQDERLIVPAATGQDVIFAF